MGKQAIPSLSKRKSALFAVLFFLLLLLLLELAGNGIRLLFNLGPEVPGLNVPHKTRLWVMKTDFDGPVSKGKHHVTTNSMGLRSPEIRPGDPRDWIRLLVLGDSVSFGYRVSNDQTWPRILEKLLNGSKGKIDDSLPGERTPARGYHEVINAGVLGYGTFQEMALLEEMGPSLKPDLTILQFYPNDPIENYTYHPLSTLRLLLPRSALYNLLRAGFLYVRGASDYRLFESPGKRRDAFRESQELAKKVLETKQEESVFSRKNPELLSEAWARTEKAVGGVAQIADRIDTKLVAVAFPAMSQVYGSNRSTVYQDSLAAICGRLGVPLVDLLDDFQGNRELYDGLHPSVEGYEEAARIIRERIESYLRKIELEKYSP